MGLFDRFRKPAQTCLDPTFGSLVRAHGSWGGSVRFPPTGGDVQVLLDVAPTDGHHTLFTELIQRYSSLKPAIADALFTLWEPHLRELRRQREWIVSTPGEIEKHTRLDCIELGLPSSIVLGYGFTADVGWDDAMFSIKVIDWHVRPGSLDD